jgi:hypothetical protein
MGLILTFVLCEMVQRVLQAPSLLTYFLERQKDLEQARFTIYFLGRFWEKAPWGAGLIAWCLKMPLTLLALGVGALLLLQRSVRLADPLLHFCLGVGVLGFALMLGVRSIIASGHYLFVFPFLLWVCAAGYAAWREDPTHRRIAVFVVAVFLSAESFSAWSSPLAFTNISVGGTNQGWKYMADSDQDWGQGLPVLAAWLRREKIQQVFLAYAGAGDPRLYSIRYQDVFSPALVSKEYRGEIFKSWPDRMILALGTKVAQSEPAAFAWILQNRKPTFPAGPTFLIFDLTRDPEARQWLSAFYRATGRAPAVTFD